MESKRIQWIDVSKGMAIILMVLGHTSIPDVLSRFIFAFHMPLFFLVSGWCTQWEKTSFPAYLGKKVRTLLLPFLVYSAVVLGIAAVIGLKEVSAGTVLREGWKGYALWFVPVLFLALLLAKAIMVYIKRVWARYALSGVLLITGVALSYYKLYLPWALSTVPYATCLVLLGTSLRKFQAYIQKPLWWLFPACLALTFAISYKWRLDLAWNQITPVVLLTAGALAGSVMVFTLSAWLTRSKWITAVLQAIGKETFIIMAFSQIFYLMACHYLPGHKLACYGIMALLLLSVALIKNGFKRIL